MINVIEIDLFSLPLMVIQNLVRIEWNGLLEKECLVIMAYLLDQPLESDAQAEK